MFSYTLEEEKTVILSHASYHAFLVWHNAKAILFFLLRKSQSYHLELFRNSTNSTTWKYIKFIRINYNKKNALCSG